MGWSGLSALCLSSAMDAGVVARLGMSQGNFLPSVAFLGCKK